MGISSFKGNGMWKKLRRLSSLLGSLLSFPLSFLSSVHYFHSLPGAGNICIFFILCPCLTWRQRSSLGQPNTESRKLVSPSSSPPVDFAVLFRFPPLLITDVNPQKALPAPSGAEPASLWSYAKSIAPWVIGVTFVTSVLLTAWLTSARPAAGSNQ